MIIAVKCPSCYANLQIPDDVEFVTCEYCDTSIKVRDVVRVETDYDVPEWIKIADNAYKGENYEEAYEYYNMVLEKESFRANAWIGKGLAAGRLSDDNDPRFDEMIQLVTYGLSITDEKKKNSETIAVRKELLAILQDYFEQIKKDKFDFKSDFDDYFKESGAFLKGCIKCHENFFSKDIVYTKFYCLVLRSYLYKGYEYGAESRTLIGLTEPKRTEYKNKLKVLESELKALDSNYETFDDGERKGAIKKIIVTGSAIVLVALIVIFGIKYFKNISDESKAKVTPEQSSESSKKLPGIDYEIVNKSIKNKKIIYTIYTETESLSDIKNYADAIIKRDEEQALTIFINFLSNKAEAAEYAGKEITLKKNRGNAPEFISATVKYTKGKELKELNYYDKSKLVSEKF